MGENKENKKRGERKLARKPDAPEVEGQAQRLCPQCGGLYGACSCKRGIADCAGTGDCGPGVYTGPRGGGKK